MSGTTYALTYDAENQLTGVTRTQGTSQQVTRFYYDADGNRVRQVAPDGTSTVYIGQWYEERQSVSKGRVLTSYYYLGGQRVALRQGAVGQAGVVYYLHADHLGSTSEVSTATASLSGRERYFPYGQVRYTWGSLPTTYNFTGQRLDGTGLLYYGARYYAPRIGRFTQADTIVPEPGNPQSLNRFAYVNNNPLKYTDPTGYCAEGDQDCWNQAWFIYQQFGIQIEGIWSLDELIEITKALDDIALALADANGYGRDLALGRGLFRGVWTNTTFKRLHEGRNEYTAFTQIGGSTIEFYNSWRSAEVGGARFTVAHELAHAWDFQSGAGLGDIYIDEGLLLGFGVPVGVGAISYDFMHAVGARAECGYAPDCKSTGRYIEGPQAAYRDYSRTGPNEDWADSFAAWVHSRPLTQRRHDFVQLKVSQLTYTLPPNNTWHRMPARLAPTPPRP
ncbi:MAG: hypothetical protein C4294_19055 [Nitrospiraceae bacterium]